MQVLLSTLALAAVARSATITTAPSPTQIEVAKRAASSPSPLTDYTYAYSAIPYQVNPYAVGRGPQSGYNICNSTTSGPDSQCQTLIANSIGDFCIWSSPTTSPNGTIGDDEAAVVAYCTNDQHGARVIPPGAITGLQVLRTSAYTQWTGRLNLTAVNLQADDTGGELDPHGADELGNPLGGLVYSSGLPTGNNKTLTQVISWNQFIGSSEFCLKLCDPSVTSPNYCENKFDLLGCAYNMPASYEDNVFLDCDSDLQQVVGTYVSGGQTITWSQPSSLPADSTLPWTPTIPATSNCKTYQSTDIFPTSLLGYQTSALSTSAKATSTSKDSKSSGASRSGSTTGPAATASGAKASGGSSSTTKNGAVAVAASGVLAFASIFILSPSFAHQQPARGVSRPGSIESEQVADPSNSDFGLHLFAAFLQARLSPSEYPWPINAEDLESFDCPTPVRLEGIFNMGEAAEFEAKVILSETRQWSALPALKEDTDMQGLSERALGKRKAVKLEEASPKHLTPRARLLMILPQDEERLSAIDTKPSFATDLPNRSLPTPAATPTFFSSFTLPPLPLPALPVTPRSPAAKRRTKQETPPPAHRLPPFPLSPSPRKAPSPRKPPPLPLDRLFPAGTITLHNYSIRDGFDSDVGVDGWIKFSKDVLVSRTVAPEPLVLDEPSQTPTKGGNKRGRSKGGKSSPAKKRTKVVHDKTLDDLVACSQASVFLATARAIGDDVILRIYLVQEDLPELAQIDPKRRLKRPPASTVRSVFQSIRCDRGEWEGRGATGEAEMLLEEKDGRSLLEMFHGIEVPGEGGFENLDAPQAIKDRLWLASSEQPEDVKTELYPYQQASVAKMLSRELAPSKTISPHFLAKSSFLDRSRRAYISLDGDVALSPPRFREPRSGILAEDMGVGKSLMVLALIMSTRSELPSLEGVSTWLDNSLPSPPPVLLTRQSVDFPFEAERRERVRLRPRVPDLLQGALQIMSVVEVEQHEAKLEKQRRDDLEDDARRPPLPSLRSLMINMIKTDPGPIRYPHDDPLLVHGDLFDTLQTSPPFYRLYPSHEQLNSREGRRGKLKPSNIIVAATTLLVVPTDLVRQWNDEIHKHVEPGSLRVLTLRTAKDPFPAPREMATFDVVLLSAARFTDAAEADDRSLRGVHWKRLVVDEGHVLSSTNLTRKLAEELRCECRWAVSGTPSTNLRGASVDGKLAAAGNIIGGTREDLDKLGQLYSRFLRHPAFPKPSTLRELVGDHPSRLADVFNNSIIRHRTSLVKSVLSIPPLSVKVTFVEMEEAERKMYNALTAIFASNAIQSQRKDQDYFFHKANAGPLKSLCSNLATASTFFASSEIGARLREGATWAQERLESEKAAKWTEEDRQGLAKAIAVMKEAYDDREWNLVTGEVSVAIEVVGLDDEIIKAFGGLTAAKNPLNRSLVSLHQLTRLRQDLKELRHADVKGWNDDEELVEELITFEARRKRYDVEIANRKSKDEEEVVSVFKKRPKKDTTPLVPIPSDSMFRNVQLLRTSSAKINYLLDQFRSYPEDKFIVFSSSNVDLLFANLSEALDLFGISHIIFAGSSSRKGQDRGLKAQRFNSSSAQEVQVILVDVEVGGRGVGLTAASRVIMLEPIWKPDLELQATKRAHRLGQTRPVELQILIVKDTYEDALFKRRAQIAPEDFSKKVKVPQQDSSLRTTLQSAQYLEPTERARRGMPVSKALDDPPVYLLTEGGHDVSSS
ncbi:hypothetical protein JCM11491_007080 [Sporobolomyces phaffii]